jgi:dihydroneopterin aldolase
MNGKELESCLNYDGMIREVRQFAVDKKLAPIEKLAIMSTGDICNLIVENYEVISCESECVSIIDKEFSKEYNKHVAYFER